MNNDNTNQAKNTPAQTLIAGLIVACFMAYLAIPSLVLACINIALFILCAYKICWKRASFTVILAVTSIMFVTLPIASLARLISLIVSAAAGGAMLYGGKRSRAVFIAFSLAVYALSVAVTRSPLDSLAVFSALPPAVALAVSSYKKIPRVSAICATSAVFLIMSLIPLAVSTYSEFGTDIRAFIDSARMNFSSFITEMFNKLMEPLGEEYANALSPSLVQTFAEFLFALVPAMYVISTNIMAFLSSYIHIIIRQSLGKAPEKQEIVFLLSPVSAWVYIISFIGMFFVFGDSDAMYVFSVALESINLILTPSFVLVGILSFVASTRVRGRKQNFFKTVIIILSFIYCGTFLLYLFATMGVIATLNANKIQRRTRNS